MHLLILIAALGAAPVLDVPLTSGYQQSSTVVSDRSGRGNHGTLVGTPPTAGANSVDFNGTNDGVDLGDADIFSFGNGTTDSPFTISAWINMDDSDGFMIACKGTYGDRGEYLFYTNNAYKLVLQIIDQSVPARILRYYDTPLTAYENQWIYVVAAYGGGGVDTDIDMWLNGVMVDDATSTNGVYVAMENNTYPLYIGKYGATLYADGEISNLKILPEKWTQSDVDREYAIGRRVFASKTDSLYNRLVLDVPLTSGYLQSATVPSDRSQSKNHLNAVSGDPTISSTGTNFDGNDYLYRNVADYRQSDNVGTVSFWAKVSSGGIVYGFSVSDAGSTNHFLGISINGAVSSGAVNITLKEGTTSTTTTTTTGYDDNTWHYIVVTTNGSRYLIYVDGALKTSAGTDDGRWFNDLTLCDNISVGAVVRSSVVYGTGDVAYLKVQDYELSATDVAKQYAIGRRIFADKVDSLYNGLVLDIPFTTSYASASDTIASDRVPNGVDAMTMQGNATLTATGMTLDGTGDFAQHNVANWRSGDSSGTINIWVTPTVVSGYPTLFSAADTVVNTSYFYLSIDPSGKVYVRIQKGASSNIFSSNVCPSGDMTAGNQYMITLSSSGSDYKIHLNGQACTITIGGIGINNGAWFHDLQANLDNLVFGALVRVAVGGETTGTIIDGKQWDRQLTDTEVAKLYTLGPGPHVTKIAPAGQVLKVSP